MAEYTCCSSIAFERPDDNTFTATCQHCSHMLPSRPGGVPFVTLCVQGVEAVEHPVSHPLSVAGNDGVEVTFPPMHFDGDALQGLVDTTVQCLRDSPSGRGEEDSR
jgi:hypothetical protein